MKKMQRKNSAPPMRGGFTLTELLIVMAILVLLVSMVGPSLLGSKAKADINSVVTQIGMFKSSLERYALDMNKFPSSEQGLAALISAPTSDGSGEDLGDESDLDLEEEDLELEGDDGESGGGSSNWDGPYINTDKLPKDPWGNSYQYEFPGTHNKRKEPDIWSFGPDGEEGTKDDINSWKGKGTSEDGELADEEFDEDSAE